MEQNRRVLYFLFVACFNTSIVLWHLYFLSMLHVVLKLTIQSWQYLLNKCMPNIPQRFCLCYQQQMHLDLQNIILTITIRKQQVIPKFWHVEVTFYSDSGLGSSLRFHPDPKLTLTWSEPGLRAWKLFLNNHLCKDSYLHLSGQYK